MDQKTFCIIPIKSKDEIKQKIKQKGFRMLSERSIDQVNEFTEMFQIKEEQMPILAFALRGKDVIRVWSSMVKEAKRDKFFFHASKSVNDAEKEIKLFQASLVTLLSKKNLETKKQKPDARAKKVVMRSSDDKKKPMNTRTKTVPTKKTEEKIVTNKEESCALVEHQEPIVESHPSTGSSVFSDENDAEVAAATSSIITTDHDLERYSIKSRNSSLSPSSVASSRPQTPEVHELLNKFEQFIQIGQQDKSRPNKISNEIRTKPPTGSRVKNMVEFFMDENLNKWEF
ncbi:unnamed protein product [Rhizopus stolonifer]